ncbi:MAG: cytochrome ubiquinol oxidase subunit I [Deltaproteobacteria bacterium]|nr:cytochrome ubiquinol oxidase subunit I [Deltaproteobacteria bacterium]
MNPLLAARWQMELSLAFHMVFAAVGMGLPVLLLGAEAMAARTGEAHWKDLARRWAKYTAVLFAVGAVSGTALSFELGLLWPGFMAWAGAVLGPAFALEGYAFFLEAIFLGLYLYGAGRLSPRTHRWTAVPVAVSGLASGVIVTAANAWMQCPTAFTEVGGVAVPTEAFAVFRATPWPSMAVHAALSCYVSVAFAVAGLAAGAMLRGRQEPHHRAALGLSMAFGAVSMALQLVSGHDLAGVVARTQPVKLAAMEAHFETSRRAPALLGGLPDTETGTVRGALRVPGALSMLATGSLDGEVPGLRAYPRDRWPSVTLVHLSFDVMVGAGSALAALSALWWLLAWRRQGAAPPRWLLWGVVLGAPLGFLALEAGWIVTEAGRQPWVVQGHLLTARSVTPRTDVGATLALFTALYLALSAATWAVLRTIARAPWRAPS